MMCQHGKQCADVAILDQCPGTATGEEWRSVERMINEGCPNTHHGASGRGQELRKRSAPPFACVLSEVVPDGG